MSDSQIIHTEKLSKQYRLGISGRKVDAVIDLDLDVCEGEVFAFLGLNGAGKTTTIKLLLDHAHPSSGDAYLFGINSRSSRARQEVGYLPDLPHFYRFLTALELLDYSGRLFGLRREERSERCRRLIKLVGLEGREDEPLHGYSRGMLQRIGLAQALINNPRLVILDEPLGGLDPMGRVELRNIIAGLRNEGKTVFFCSHILDDAQRIADRIGIIHQGRLLATGILDDLLTSKLGWEVEIEYTNTLDINRLCEENGWSNEIINNRNTLIIPDDNGINRIYGLAAEQNLRIGAINRRRVSLEEAFIEELSRWET